MHISSGGWRLSHKKMFVGTFNLTAKPNLRQKYDIVLSTSKTADKFQYDIWPFCSSISVRVHSFSSTTSSFSSTSKIPYIIGIYSTCQYISTTTPINHALLTPETYYVTCLILYCFFLSFCHTWPFLLKVYEVLCDLWEEEGWSGSMCTQVWYTFRLRTPLFFSIALTIQ